MNKQHNHEHDHDHSCGCGHSHQHHDANANAHCHCGSCSIQHQQGDSDGSTTTGECCGHDHSDGGCGCGGCGGGGDGGEEDSDSDHHHGEGCGCGHDHEHGEAVEPRTLWQLGIGAGIFVAALVSQSLLPGVVTLLVFLAAYLIIGGDVLLRAAKNILRGQIFDENFLMAIATIGAFAIGDYAEGIAVMLFYQVGELFQSYAVGRSRRSIAELMDIRPDHANLALADGGTRTVPPDTVTVGAEIIIKPGEKIPLDSQVLEGSSFVDTAALTGESVPRSVKPGDTLFSGCINQTGLLRAQVTKEFGQSTVSKILELAESASSKKAKAQQFITRFARVYTPLVVLAAVLLAVVPPFFTGLPFSHWLKQALVFLVISCPCALVISVPLSFFGGIGGASRCGVLVKGGNHLEALAKAELVVFDKTGTLTKGVFEVTQLQPQGIDSRELLATAAAVERFSTHPIARSIAAAWEAQGGSEAAVSDYQEHAGRGVSAQVEGQLVLAGNHRLLEEQGVTLPDTLPQAQATQVLVARAGQYIGRLVISDRVKEDAAQAIVQLRQLGVQQTVMLTGDAQATAQAVAAEVGVDRYFAQLLPGDKVDHVEQLLHSRSSGGSLIFVGDGINDAPVLARADVGVAMGALGSDAAIEAADVVLMTDQPTRLAAAIRVARKTMSIVRQNVVMALGIKLVVMVLGVFGIASMWLAVFADVGVSVLAILNAIRALDSKKLL